MNTNKPKKSERFEINPRAIFKETRLISYVTNGKESDILHIWYACYGFVTKGGNKDFFNIEHKEFSKDQEYSDNTKKIGALLRTTASPEDENFPILFKYKLNTFFPDHRGDSFDFLNYTLYYCFKGNLTNYIYFLEHFKIVENRANPELNTFIDDFISIAKSSNIETPINENVQQVKKKKPANGEVFEKVEALKLIYEAANIDIYATGKKQVFAELTSFLLGKEIAPSGADQNYIKKLLYGQSGVKLETKLSSFSKLEEMFKDVGNEFINKKIADKLKNIEKERADKSKH